MKIFRLVPRSLAKQKGVRLLRHASIVAGADICCGSDPFLLFILRTGAGQICRGVKERITEPQSRNFVPGELLVRFRPGSGLARNKEGTRAKPFATRASIRPSTRSKPRTVRLSGDVLLQRVAKG